MGVSIFGHEISVKTTDCCHGDTPGSRVPPAVNLFVKVTDGCNARCLFCSNAGAPHTTGPFDTAKLFSVVDELQRNRIIINRFNITGGEPAVVAPLVEELLQELRDIAQNAVDGMSARRRKDQGEVCKTVRAAVSSYLFKHTKRSPMVIPMVTML